jgi:predicted N-acetyltransferase YhbS
MTLYLRKPTPADAPVLSDICYRAFKAIADAHNFPPDFPSAEATAGMIGGLIGRDGCFGVVAEAGGRIVGSNFLGERNPISGVGPITVDPDVQNDGAGRMLMQAVMERSKARGFAGIRLVQAGYHSRSLALYLKLGFEAREHLSCLLGPAVDEAQPGCTVRPATADDQPACDALCFRVHGHARGGDLADAVAAGSARVVERAGRITGYATAVAIAAHAVAETNDDLKALIGAAGEVRHPGFLVPTRNGELMRWGLSRGLRVSQTMTLMTIGLYNEPAGAWLPSVLF